MAGPPGGRTAPGGATAAGVPATVALLADDAGAPTGVLGEDAVAATVTGGVTVAQDESIAAIAMNKTERTIQKTPKTEDNFKGLSPSLLALLR